MTDIIETTDPGVNAAVHAAAGTGKTWLLTTRIIRLLLAGAAPGAILAITFTRKAAGEIYTRVCARLLAMAKTDTPGLMALLAEIGAETDAATQAHARGLYEALLTSETGLRTTTFHAFCQEILRQFPLEAEVPPGFELLEAADELQWQAWRRFVREASRDPKNPVATSLDLLLRECGGVYNVRQALVDFLAHRNDWWAYTESEADAFDSACHRLKRLMDISEDDAPIEALLEDNAVSSALAHYRSLWTDIPGAASQSCISHIDNVQDNHKLPQTRYDTLCRMLLTASGTRRVLRLSKTVVENLGVERVEQLWALNEHLTQALIHTRESLYRLWTFNVSRAWYACGQQFIEHYQQLKWERGLLDFTDLEWKTYCLLNRSRYAEWIQYKLDQRIDHLLVDEFQDTNPTQWRLLLPLLEEMAAGNHERRRSIFIVGDVKQSIYRFRRADPTLFDTAHNWIKHHMQARTSTQHISWRSSPAIIEFINMVFGNENDDSLEPPQANDEKQRHYRLHEFQNHDTRHKNRWGHAELLPLIPRNRHHEDPARPDFRHPLLRPRIIDEDERHRIEGEAVAARIQTLIGLPIPENGGSRPLVYGDIMILMRDRTHIDSYEHALREAGIPYTGGGRGSFMNSLETQDIVHLIKAIIAPYDDLALASVLRSPIFACGHGDMIRIARLMEFPFWSERLKRIASTADQNTPLGRANQLLQRWTGYADRIPVHDLLDRIYYEGNIIARYKSAVPVHLRHRVENNLIHILELALEVDSGRYPSLAHFLSRLQNAVEETDTPPAVDGDHGNRVRMMTIHAAKGLEAPVVYLVNTARGHSSPRRGARALIQWPADRPRPRHFHLIGNKQQWDSVSRELMAEQGVAEDREEANLLYVAMTRAQYMLFISGCEHVTGRGWYGFIEQRLCAAESTGKTDRPALEIHHQVDADGRCISTCGKIQYGRRGHAGPTPKPAPPARPLEVDPALTRPLPEPSGGKIINPSALVVTDGGAPSASGPVTSTIAKCRGVIIHRMLDGLSNGDEPMTVLNEMRLKFDRRVSKKEIERYWQEAKEVFNDPVFRDLYEPSRYRSARNELPLLYRHEGNDVYGIIDRLIVGDEEIILVDYKTHAQATPANMARLAEPYFDQMLLYAKGVQLLWPDTPLRALLLFTACKGTVEVLQPGSV